MRAEWPGPGELQVLREQQVRAEWPGPEEQLQRGLAEQLHRGPAGLRVLREKQVREVQPGPEESQRRGPAGQPVPQEQQAWVV